MNNRNWHIVSFGRVALTCALALAVFQLLPVKAHSSDEPAAVGMNQMSVTVTIQPGAVGKGPQAFGQNPLQVPLGATVTWVNNDTVSHTVTSDTIPRELDSPVLAPGQTYQHTFNTAGRFPYHCEIHGQASMSGEIDVAGGGATGTPSPSPSPSVSPTPSPAPSSTMTAMPGSSTPYAR